jgi:hypothetical protein
MRIIFRADTRGPDVIFTDGFSPRMPGGIKITDGGQMTGGVSTSKDLGVSIRYASAYDGWVYVAWLSEGVDVLAKLAKKGKKEAFTNAMSQMEIAAKKIPGNHIIAARRCRQSGDNAEMVGDIFSNTNRNVAAQEIVLGEAFLGSNVTVSKDYAH